MFLKRDFLEFYDLNFIAVPLLTDNNSAIKSAKFEILCAAVLNTATKAMTSLLENHYSLTHFTRKGPGKGADHAERFLI